MRCSSIALLLGLVTMVASSPIENSPAVLRGDTAYLPHPPAETFIEALALNPSPPDPLQKRDGAHHGAHHGGGSSFGASGTSSYSSAPNSFVVSSGGHGKGHGKGHGGGFGGSGHHGSGGGHVVSHITSNSIGGSGYGAPPVKPSYHAPEPPKQTGYYYYYYPVQIEQEKKGEKGFMDKMKKLFEPMMYPWNAMMDYFGYGDYDDYDYDYDTYSSYARSLVSRASEYVPWDSVNEVGNVVTQDECIEFFVCQLGSYGREYRSMHFLLDYILPDVDGNTYSRSFKESVLKKTDCHTYSCPIVKRYDEQPF